MISLVKGRRKTLFPRFVPFLLLTVNTMKHLFRLIMSLDLTLPSFLLTLEEKNSFIHFISPTDVRSTRVMCFAWGFPFQLGRAGMKRNTGKNNGFPYLDKNRKFGNVRQVPTREFPTNSLIGTCLTLPNLGFLLGIL